MKNGMLQKLEAKYEAKNRYTRLFSVQQSYDMVAIAANEAFGFGPERVKTLLETLDKVYTEYATMVLEDAKTDKEIWYAKDKIDSKLKAICGKYFIPWEERYRF